MIDLRVLRANPQVFRDSQHARGESSDVVDALIAADEARRAAVSAADDLRGAQKAFGPQIKSATPETRPALLEQASAMATQVKAAEAAENEADAALRAAQMAVPNLILDAPAGGVDDFVVIREVGDKPTLAEPKDHLELGEALKMIDTVRGAKVSGARFYFLTGVGALMELALVNMAMARAGAEGFTPVIAPA